MIFIGSDHKGFDLKESLKKELDRNEIDFVDYGNFEYNPLDDYPDYAFIVGEKVQQEKSRFGILICATGEGMTIAANKVNGIRAALCENEYTARLAREHNDANILVLDSSIDLETALELINIFITTPFSNEERHIRRIQKISDYEKSRKIV